MKTKSQKILLFLKGIGMGSADIVPGVSGGTIAFITGIYEELLASIKAVDFDALKLLLKGNFNAFWLKINGSFLLILVSGIVVSLFSLARAISYFLEHHHIQLWSFFFGLILISALVVSRDISKWDPKIILALLAGVVAAYLITEAVPATTPNSYLLIFLSGAVAICAMILPGISGSFILLLLGKYSFILEALKEFNLPVILLFVLGCATGLLSFSRVVSWMLNKFRNLTVATLVGFMLGSLNKVWPWKETMTTYLDRYGEVQPLTEKNILPTTYQALGFEPHIWEAVLFLALGVALVAFLEKVAQRMQS